MKNIKKKIIITVIVIAVLIFAITTIIYIDNIADSLDHIERYTNPRIRGRY